MFIPSLVIRGRKWLLFLSSSHYQDEQTTKGWRRGSEAPARGNRACFCPSLMHRQFSPASAQLSQWFHYSSSDMRRAWVVSSWCFFHNCGMFHVGACTVVHVCGRASCEKRLPEQLPDRQTRLITMQQLNQPAVMRHTRTFRCTRRAHFALDCMHICP